MYVCVCNYVWMYVRMCACTIISMCMFNNVYSHVFVFICILALMYI